MSTHVRSARRCESRRLSVSVQYHWSRASSQTILLGLPVTRRPCGGPGADPARRPREGHAAAALGPCRVLRGAAPPAEPRVPGPLQGRGAGRGAGGKSGDQIYLRNTFGPLLGSFRGWSGRRSVASSALPRFWLHVGIGVPTDLESERLFVAFAAAFARDRPCVFAHFYEGPLTQHDLLEMQAGPMFWS